MTDANLLVALRALLIDANRLCDRNLGGTYEEDCRRSIVAVQDALLRRAGSPQTEDDGGPSKAAGTLGDILTNLEVIGSQRTAQLELRRRDTPENRDFWASINSAVANWERVRPEWSRAVRAGSAPPQEKTK